MHNKAHVVSLAEHGATTATGQLPALLIRLRDLTGVFVKRQLQELFTAADDTLFDMADRAGSNQEQNSLFETMRELRLKQKNLQHGYLQQLGESFASLTQFRVGQPADSIATDRDSLTLVQPDELEENVAINNMISKVMNNDADLLEDLNARIGHVLAREIPLGDNPLGPASLSRLFLDILNQTGFTDIQIKLILLKLFERSVLEDLGLLYADSNQILLEAGILPALRTRGAVKKTPAASYDNSLPATPAGQAEVSFQDIQSLLRNTGTLPGITPPSTDAVPVSSGDLMRLLTHLQQHNSQNQQLSGAMVRQQIDSILQRASQQSQKTRVVGEMANDAINLVSMLFEFILDDRTLPDSLKALIGRLQIPMLKVAVLDQSFFDSASHPARRLLNELGSAALGWSGKDSRQQDKLLQKMEDIVHRLLNEFTDDPVIFADILQEFTTFYGTERRRSELVEQRVRDAEEGRARTQQARLRIKQELNQRLLGKTLPETVVQLLQDNWSQVLLLRLLRHGEEATDWQDSLQLMDDLIWSIGQHHNRADGERLKAMVPALVSQLREGFEEAALDPFATSLLLTQLEVLHIQAFQQLKYKLAQPEAGDPATGSNDTTSTPVEPVTLSPEELPELLQQAAEEMAGQEEIPVPAMVEVSQDVELPGKDETGEETEPEENLLPDDDPAFGQADQVRPGSWFELRQEDGNSIRCKLSAIIRSTGRYIFVNRHGLKVLDKNRNGLAWAFKQEQLRMLDDALLFDRALESVINNLRQMKDI
ncbi:DUF1631 domain-containing protein [Thiopseudomonas denitrificans]|uniref:Uncharacterized protein DUF1631 n=1 Tax=Thiopseudomonas denitrificans TaxID=1501432 RepID=A0A4R6TY56_9GAMM|nr:DUF1631 domain-containing protein [Thiopseudomonas denitrificans]TDQ38850.1 uncharacterized protein DUF1631 [Thiopseudomonas denitrificans]